MVSHTKIWARVFTGFRSLSILEELATRSLLIREDNLILYAMPTVWVQFTTFVSEQRSFHIIDHNSSHKRMDGGELLRAYLV